MLTNWPTANPHSTDIELKVGRLQSLFFSRTFEWKVCFFLALLPLTVCVIATFYYFTQPFADGAALLAGVMLGIFLILAAMTLWYRRQVRYFALCELGCAYSMSPGAAPIVLPWSDVQAINMEDEAYLKVEENAILGFKVSETLYEASRNFLHIKGTQESIRLKLSEFSEKALLVEKVLQSSSDQPIELDHSRVESPELQEVKAKSGGVINTGQTKYYAIGVILMIIFIILRVVVRMNR